MTRRISGSDRQFLVGPSDDAGVTILCRPRSEWWRAVMYPWNNRSGRLVPLKLIVFAALFAPAIWVAAAYCLDLLGARPLNEAIHQIGLWTIRLIFLALAVMPLREVLQWQQLILVRRMIGVAAFAYAMIHFGLYTADQMFDLEKVASEIALRIYLTIG